MAPQINQAKQTHQAHKIHKAHEDPPDTQKNLSEIMKTSWEHPKNIMKKYCEYLKNI